MDKELFEELAWVFNEDIETLMDEYEEMTGEELDFWDEI